MICGACAEVASYVRRNVTLPSPPSSAYERRAGGFGNPRIAKFDPLKSTNMRANHGSISPPPPEVLVVAVPVPEDEFPTFAPLGGGGGGLPAELIDNAIVVTEPSVAILRKAPFPVSATYMTLLPSTTTPRG
jgi:hypothetical protein